MSYIYNFLVLFTLENGKTCNSHLELCTTHFYIFISHCAFPVNIINCYLIDHFAICFCITEIQLILY